MADNILSGIEIPANRDNEALILSNAINNAERRKHFVRNVHPLDFRFKEFQAISWAIKEIEDNNLAMDLDLILLKTKASPYRYDMTYEFVQELANAFQIVPESNYKTHVQQLHLDKIKSELAKHALEGIYQSCLNPSSDLAYLTERVNYLRTIIEKGFSSSSSEFKTMDVIMDEYVKMKSEGTNFRTTGFSQLDSYLTDGFRDGKITIVAGLPGMGKSSFTLSSMKNLSYKGIWTAQFALEMDNMSLASKLLAFNSRIPLKRISKYYDKLTSEEKNLLQHEIDRLKKNQHILFNDKPTQSLKQIREQVMILQDQIKSSYIVVPIDLFGKIREFADADNFAKNYEQKLNEVQIMARELGVHFILVAQINRGAGKRFKFNRPKMSDLKNSGAFEEVADIILAVHRPYYDPEVALKSNIMNPTFQQDDEGFNTQDSDIEEDPNKNIAEIIVLKQRMGTNNVLVNFFFDPDTTRFAPIDLAFQDEINRTKTDLLGTNDDDE